MGPTNDSPSFAPAMREASRHIHFDHVLADAAYDSEANHSLCRKELGIRFSVIPARKRNTTVRGKGSVEDLFHIPPENYPVETGP